MLKCVALTTSVIDRFDKIDMPKHYAYMIGRFILSHDSKLMGFGLGIDN